MRHEVIDIPHGWDGTRATVAKAYQLVNASLRDPVVVTTAQDIVRYLPERDKLAEVQAVSTFVRRNVRYTNEGIETLKTPRLMLDEIRQKGRAVGDCDDHVILWAALHRALGNQVRFRVVSQRPDRLANHIYGEVYVPGRGWVSDELIVKHRPLGWRIPVRETTKEVVYLGGLGSLGGDSDMDIFKPGGGAVVHEDYFVPRGEVFAVSPYVTNAYGTKHGGMVQRDEIGRDVQVGVLPAAATAAAPLLPKVKELIRKKKKRKRPAPAPAPVREEDRGFGAVLPWLAAGAAAIFLLPKLIGGRR